MDLNTVQEIVAGERAAVDGWQPGDAWLAGGTWLFSEPQPEVRRLVDLTAFAWPALTASGDGLELAATCTFAELARWPRPRRWPATVLIPQCCDALLGSFKVRNTATVGGNLCLALPAGPMISLAVALDGVCTVWGRNAETRSLSARELILGPGESALAPGALLRSLLLPDAALRCTTAFRRFSLSPLGRSAVVVIGRAAPAGGEVLITVTASVPRPAQLRFDRMPSVHELRDALDEAQLEFYDDVHGDPGWREHLTRMYAEEVRGELIRERR
ncbi:MAG TPA: FAD binding domain-containing protein [Solirubrobacteraceae bacterium]|jgi:CO/xanthine dehydrogenase FAD-binding subunit|nr:FAD binding domain-containing protein [Solirubrobacteraceae bacterium]